MWDDISLIIALADIPGPQRTLSGNSVTSSTPIRPGVAELVTTRGNAETTTRQSVRGAGLQTNTLTPAAVEQYKLVLCRPEAFRMLYRPWTAKTAKDKKELFKLQEMLGYVYCFDMPWHAQYKARLAQGDNNDGKKESDFGQD